MILNVTFLDGYPDDEVAEPSGKGAVDLGQVKAILEDWKYQGTRLFLGGRWLLIDAKYESVFPLWTAARGVHPTGNQIKTLLEEKK